MTTNMVIGIAAGVVTAGVFAAIYWMVYRPLDDFECKNSALLKQGVPAEARILRIWQPLQMVVSDIPGGYTYICAVLEVIVPGRPPVQAKMKFKVQNANLANFKTGNYVQGVKADPKDPARIAVEGACLMTPQDEQPS
jgi:hypothetical protein